MGKFIQKVAHLADIHIRKIPTRNDEYKKVFNNLYSSLEENKPDRIVIVGDLLNDFLDLQGEQLVLAKEFLTRLSEIALVIITRGNHEMRKSNLNRKDTVSTIVEILDNPNIVYYNKTGFYRDNDVIWAVWHHGEEKNNPWKKKKEIPSIDDNITIIDLFHDPVNGCISDNNLEMKNNLYYKLSDFKGEYGFWGDIHKHQYLDKNKKKAYCGSLIEQKFSEGDGQFHGYLLWDIVNEVVKKVPIENEHSYNTIDLTPFIDFDDPDLEIKNPTKYMKVRFNWKTLPNSRNSENEFKLKKYITNKYPESEIIISNLNEFVEDENVDVDSDFNVQDIVQEQTQHDIFRRFLDKIGVEENIIDDVILLDNKITKMTEFDDLTNIEWSVVKFGVENFMSYEKFDIDWRNNDGLYQIVGKNAGGKTTILKAISYILYNKTIETENRIKHGDLRYINDKNGANSCKTYMVLEANGEFYGIERNTIASIKKSGEINGVSTKVNYFKLDSPDSEMNDDSLIDNLSEDDRFQTQKRIEEIIGSYDNFMRIVMTTSDTLNSILSNDMAVFTDSLLYDSGLDVFDKKLNTLKEYVKDLNKKSRITCNIENKTNEIEELKNEISTNNQLKTVLENETVPQIKEKIEKGDEFLEETIKKLYKIDPEIQNLKVEDVKEEIIEHKNTINEHQDRKTVIETSIKELKETFNEKRYLELVEEKDVKKQEENKLKLDKKEIEKLISEQEHKIEIINGEIFNLKKEGKIKKDDIENLKNSRTCPTCGQQLKERDREIINNKIKKFVEEVKNLANIINNKTNVDIVTHENEIQNLKINIDEIDNKIENISINMESLLIEIGELVNDKNDVEKRKEFQNEMDNIPIKIQNEELKIESLQQKVKSYENSLIQINDNKKTELIINKAKERIKTLNSELDEKKEEISNLNNKNIQNNNKIIEIQNLIKEFREQEYHDNVISLYKKCVHRDGVPRQILSNYIIPKINKELKNVLSVAPFTVWLDENDLRPKLSYYKTPSSVIDAISSSGKERTFSSIVLKMALNQINVKSKPTIFLLDEVTGKLTEESVLEFKEILDVMKNKYKKLLIIEHIHEFNPDHVIYVDINEKGISSLTLK